MSRRQVSVPLGRAALELRVQYVAGQVVCGQSAWPARDEGPAGQPLPHCRRVGADQAGQEVFGRQPGHRADGQAGEVGLAGRVEQEGLQQRRDEIRRVGESPGHLAGGGQVGQQGHGQRMPAAQGQKVVPRRREDTGVGEQLPALVGVERVEAAHGDEAMPAGIGTPRRAGRVPAGQDDDAVGAQPGEEIVSQPPVDGCELLVAVDQQHRPGQQASQRPAVVGVVEGGSDGLVDRLR